MPCKRGVNREVYFGIDSFLAPSQGAMSTSPLASLVILRFPVILSEAKNPLNIVHTPTHDTHALSYRFDLGYAVATSVSPKM
jgi:hypothetical protein